METEDILHLNSCIFSASGGEGGNLIRGAMEGAGFRVFGIEPALQPSEYIQVIPDITPGSLLGCPTPENAG